MRCLKVLFAMLALAAGGRASPADDARFTVAPFDAAHWELDGGDIGFATYQAAPRSRASRARPLPLASTLDCRQRALLPHSSGSR